MSPVHARAYVQRFVVNATLGLAGAMVAFRTLRPGAAPRSVRQLARA